jgi:tetratricopeptide (TPR) repeat protein
MQKLKYIFILLAFVAACKTSQDIPKRGTKLTEAEFYSAFTEATKYALIGNYNGDFGSLRKALQLYKFCMNASPEKSAPYYQISNIYLTFNDIPKAKSYAQIAYELEDTNSWYILHLANIYQYEKNLDSLIYFYEKLVNVSNKPEYEYNLALFYSSNKEYDKSMALTKKLEEKYAGSRELYLIKHRNYAGMNQPDSAIYELENLILLFPDQFENYGMLAEYLSEINQYERSSEVYKELLRIEPDNGLANLSYGDFYLKQGKKDSALYYYKRGFASTDISIEDKIGILYNYMYDKNQIVSDSSFIIPLQKVLEDNYSDPRANALGAEYYLQAQKYDLALLELEKAINNGSKNYIIWEQYVMIANFTTKHDKVKNIYSDALKKFPDEINLYIFGGYSLYMLEEYDSILKYEAAGRAIKPLEREQKIQYLNLLADAYRAVDSIAISDSIYEEILIIDPGNLLIRNNYSYYLSVRGIQLERAEELSRLTIKKEPNNATYLDTYGWILFKQGKYKDALKYVEAAIKNGAYNNAEVLDHYGDIMFALGRCSDAIEAWEEAIKYDNELTTKLSEKIEEAKSNNCND